MSLRNVIVKDKSAVVVLTVSLRLQVLNYIFYMMIYSVDSHIKRTTYNFVPAYARTKKIGCFSYKILARIIPHLKIWRIHVCVTKTNEKRSKYTCSGEL